MKFAVRLQSRNHGNLYGLCWLGIDQVGNPFHTEKDDRATFDTPDEVVLTMRAAYKIGFDFSAWTIILDDKYEVHGLNDRNLLLD